MKKLLALVLALVMTLSLCTVTNAAFPDAADVDYKEAVDVMSAVGVFKGDEKGNFNPDANLTRETAAKLIAYLDLGEKVAEALPAVKVFSDVEANRWSAKYIAYCADAGYIAGVGDGSYNPTGELTGYAFGKLLLCVLGYDASIEQFTGSNWSIAVAKLMQSNDIAKGVDKAGSAVLTREEAAQYCLNALKADCVEYENKGTQISINGATIATGASAAKAVENKKFDYCVEDALYDATTDDTVQQLCEKLYGKDIKCLESATGDDLGRAIDEWFYEDMTDAVAKTASKADYVFVCKETYADLDEAIEEVLDKDDFDTTSAAIKSNGFSLVAGTVVELYMTKKVVDQAVYYAYDYDVIDEIDTDVSAADKKDDVTCYVTFEGMGTLKDTEIPGFDAATYVEDAYIGFIEKGDLVETFVANTVEGSISTKKTDGSSLTFAGTKYSVADGAMSDVTAKAVGADNTYTIVLDKNNYVIGIEDVETAAATLDDVYYAVAAWVVNGSDTYGPTNTYKLQLVALDGTKKVVDVEAKYDGTNDSSETALNSAFKGEFVTISDKKLGDSKANNDKFNVKLWDNAASKYDVESTHTNFNCKFTKTMTRDDDAYRFDSKTNYVLIGDSKSDLEVSTAVGGIKLDASSMDVIYITAHDKMLVQYVVIVDASEINTETDFTKDLVLVYDATDYVVGDGYVEQVVYMADGSKSTLKIDDGESYTEGFYKYAENSDGFYELDDTDIDMTVSSNFVWDEETGVVGGEFVSLYNTLLSLKVGTYTVSDIEVSGAKVVDLRDDISGSTVYDREIKSLSAIEKADDAGTVQLAMNVSKTGVATIFVVDVY